MELSLLTPSRKLVERVEVSEVVAPGIRGELNVLPNHANLVTELVTGPLKWKDMLGHWHMASVTTGYMEVLDGNVTVLSEVSELAREIDVVRAKKAEERAREKLNEGGLDDENYRKNELKLRRALLRQMLGQ